jgi:hypothetical protein
MSTFDPSHVDVEHFLETLGIENITKATQQEMRFSCPYPNHGGGDETPSCYMNLNTAQFFCHGCKEKGTALDFATFVLQISPLAAIRMLKAAYMPGAINPDAMDMQREVKKILERKDEKIVQPILHSSRHADYSMDWRAAYEAWLVNDGSSFEPADYFFGRGFLPETLEQWMFGWDDLSQRVVFPIHDLGGHLIGFKGRAHDDRKPKYLVLGDGPNGGRYGYPRYFPSHVVFGAHRYNAGVSELVVCEGELNAIAVTEKTGIPAVAINGSFFSDFHARVLRRITERVVIYLDDDPAGLQCIKGWANSRGEWHPGMIELLSPHMSVKLVPPHEKDAAELPGLEIQELVEEARSHLLLQLAG